MRINLALIISIILSVGIVTFGFTFYVVSSERIKLNEDLENRISEISDKLAKGEIFFKSKLDTTVGPKYLDSICHHYNLKSILF